MNIVLIEKTGKLIDYACGWRQSFYRRYPNGHHTPMIKYFDFTVDTRDMNAWLLSIDMHESQESFRLDKANFGLLVRFLDLPTSKNMKEHLSEYVITDKFEIYNYIFTVYTNDEKFYFMTADIKED